MTTLQFSSHARNDFCANVAPSHEPALRAELIGSHTCTAAGLTVAGNAPALVLCRELLSAGIDPDTALVVYRAGTLALLIRSIAAGAALDVRDDNRGAPRFVRYRPGPAERARIACGEARPCAEQATPVLEAPQ